MGNFSDELVYIDTDKVSVTIKGKAAHPDFQDAEVTDYCSTLKVSCENDFDAEIKDNSPAIASWNGSYRFFKEYSIHPMFYEQQNYEIVIESKNGIQAEFWHENINVRNKVTTVGRQSGILSGIINFGNEIGNSDFVIKVDGKEYLTVSIEVFPTKISYREDYKAIVSDVTAEVYNLVFDFLKKTYSNFGISDNVTSSPVEFFTIIDKIYGNFIKSTDMILAHPHHVLNTTHEVLPSYKVKRVDNKSIRWIESHPENVLKKDGKLLVSKAMAVKKQVTYNTRENQIAKFILQTTAKKLSVFKSRYLKLERLEDPEVITKIDGMIKGINRRCNTGVFADVDAKKLSIGMSLVFSMAPGYRELYKYYLMLQHGLSITGDVFNISLKDLAQLYEYWCFIKLNNIMRENKDKYELVTQDIIKVYGNGLFVSLVKGDGSSVEYRNRKTGEIITLSYNPKEIEVPTVSQKPDNVLNLQKKGSETQYEYIFDAKYRIDPALDKTTYKNSYKTAGPKEDDINTMHRYRDAIVYSKEKDCPPYERTMFGAYILFPYNNEEEYKNHKFYKSIEKVNIGGLPFLPSATNLVRGLLDELISDSAESAFERATLPIGIEEKLSKVDWNERDVLIGSLSDENQLTTYLNQKCCYISVNRLNSDVFPIRYIALCQSKKSFGSNSGIRYYGEVTSCEIIKRNENEFYRFNVDCWKELQVPISIKELGNIVPRKTNMFLLTHSSTYSELLLSSNEEYRLFYELKRVLNDVEINDSDAVRGFTVNDSVIQFNNGQIIVINGKKTNCYSISDFNKKPNAIFKRIKQDISST